MSQIELLLITYFMHEVNDGATNQVILNKIKSFLVINIDFLNHLIETKQHPVQHP